MRNRSLIFLCAFLAVLFVGAGALFAYDSNQKDMIGEGVKVGGVDVSGMTAAEARAAVSAQLTHQLVRPIVVRAGAKRWTLNPRREAGATFDVEAMVADAVAHSREGNIFTRTVRSVRGTDLNADLPADVTYSKIKVTQFVSEIQKALNHKAEDASLGFNPDGFDRVEGRDGVTINATRLHADVDAKLLGTAAPGLVGVSIHKTTPKVTKADLAKKYSTLITIDRGTFQLRFYRHLELVKKYTIAVGASGYDTPTGLYSVTDKTVDPTWYVPNKPWAGDLAGKTIPGGSADNPLKARWLGFYNGAGIHGTADEGSLGSAASHGCIRMAVSDVEELYDMVPVNTPLYIG